MCYTELAVWEAVYADAVYLFVQNFNSQPQTVELDDSYTDMLAGKDVEGAIQLDAYEVKVFRKKR